MRSSGVQWDMHGIKGNRNRELVHERTLGRYRDARHAGLQPEATSLLAIQRAEEYGNRPVVT